MGILDWLFGKPDFSYHEKERAKIAKVRERLERIDDAMERKNFATIDKELREWREDIEAGQRRKTDKT